MKNTIQNMVKKNIYLAPIFFIFVLYAVTFSYEDIDLITKWSVAFLDEFNANELSNYAEYITVNGIPANYNICAIMINSLWLAPVYLLQKLNHTVFELVIFSNWLKVLILISIFGCHKVLLNIWDILRPEKENIRKMVSVAFLTSVLVIISEITKGQIDGMSMFFMLLAYENMLKKKYNFMALAMSMSLLIKGLSIMYYIPLVLLIFSKDIIKLIQHGLILISMPALNAVITRVFFKGFAEQSAAREMALDHLKFFFSVKFGRLPIFLLLYALICALALLKCWYGKVEHRDYVLFPMATFASFFLFNKWYDQYLFYGLPFFVLFIFMYCTPETAGLSITMVNYGLWIAIPFLFPSVNNQLISSGLLNFVKPVAHGDALFKDLFINHFPYLDERVELIGAAIYGAGILLPIVQLIYSSYTNDREKLAEDDKAIPDKMGVTLMEGCQLVPAVILWLAFYYVYLKV